MKNLIFIFYLLIISTSFSFSQFKSRYSTLINLKKPTDTVDFKRPDSYLLDSLVFNKIQDLRKKNKFIEFDEVIEVFEIAQIINFTKIKEGLDWDGKYSIDIQYIVRHYFDDEKEYIPIMWELMDKKISKGRYILDKNYDYNKNYTWVHNLYYFYNIDIINDSLVEANDSDYPNNDKNISYIKFIDHNVKTKKYYYKKYMNLYDIKTDTIGYDKYEVITYDKLSDRIINFILLNKKMKHFITQPMIDFECTNESKCYQFGLAVDFNHKDIFITLANFNIF